MNLVDIRRLGEAAGATTAIFVLLGGIVTLSGGSVPPWESKKEASDLQRAIDEYHREAANDQAASQRAWFDAHISSLLTQKSVLLMQLEMEQKARDHLAAEQTKAQIEWIDYQLQHPYDKPPPAPR